MLATVRESLTDARQYALEQAGACVLVTHHVGLLVEPLSREMLLNLFESELIYLEQEHD